MLLASANFSPDRIEEVMNYARHGDLQKVSEAIVSGFPIHSRDSKGNTAIIIASGRGQVKIIQYLIENGANPQDFTQHGLFEGKSALCWAASQGRAQAVAKLIQYGADINYQSKKGVFQGKTAMMWASSQGRTDVVRLLLASGADVDFSPSEGNFKVHYSLMVLKLFNLLYVGKE
jgi:ankyrin repeat protein